jgi:hypothetical protein
MRLFVLIGVIIGAVFLGAAFFVRSAQQQVALAAMACASAIIPYVLFRLHIDSVAQHQRAQLLELLRQVRGPADEGRVSHGGSGGGTIPGSPASWMSRDPRH